MSAEPTVCPKCGGDMVQGFVVESYQGPQVIAWVEGPPKFSRRFALEYDAEKRIPIGTFRCRACGYLESYARAELGGKYDPN